MDGINGDGQQRTLDALLSQSHMSSDNNGGKFTFAGGFEDDLPQEHAYSSNTPATQHEKLLYMNGNGNVKNESPSRPSSSFKREKRRLKSLKVCLTSLKENSKSYFRRPML